MAKCRIAAGTVFLKDLSVPNQPYLSVGNAQAVLGITEAVQELPDYESVAGGNACSVRDVDSVELTLTMYDYDKKNLALAVFGEASAPAADTVVAEPVQLFLEGKTPLQFMPNPLTAVVHVGATTYVQDTDYTVDAGGIMVIAGSALAIAIAAGAGTPKFLAGTVDYDYASEDVVQALVTSGKTFAAMIHTKNKAAGAKSEIWRLHKVQFGPSASIPIISREFGQFEVKAELLSIDTAAPGESRFFTIQQQQ
jgi:hypothetical protein